MKIQSCLLAVVLLVPTSLSGVTAHAPADEAFTVNTATAGEQNYPDVAVLADGRFVVVWQSDDQDGDGWGIFARWYDWKGDALTGEVPVNTSTVGAQTRPRVDGDDSSSFVIVWDDAVRGVVARRFGGSGAPLSAEIEVTGPGPAPTDQAISVNSNGYFVVSWLESAASIGTAEAQRYDSDDFPIGDAIPVATFPDHLSWDGSAVELLDDRTFLVVWSDGEEVYARHFGAQGNPTAGQFQVSQLNYPYSSFSFDVDVGSENSGRFRMVWSTDINLLEVTAMTRTVTGTGTLGVLTDLDLPSAQNAGFSMTGSGEFVVTHAPYYPRDLEGTRFSSNHDAMANFKIAEGLGYDETSRARLAHLSADPREFVVVWQALSAGGPAYDIRARIFSSGVFLDGFESGDTSYWSASVQ